MSQTTARAKRSARRHPGVWSLYRVCVSRVGAAAVRGWGRPSRNGKPVRDGRPSSFCRGVRSANTTIAPADDPDARTRGQQRREGARRGAVCLSPLRGTLGRARTLDPASESPRVVLALHGNVGRLCARCSFRARTPGTRSRATPGAVPRGQQRRDPTRRRHGDTHTRQAAGGRFRTNARRHGSRIVLAAEPLVRRRCSGRLLLGDGRGAAGL